jgi:acyl-coenzyme A synthetase/AMP-(fatty) acid ligase
VFDYHDGDVYWCTADVGWVTGHSYIVYGPLANGATTLMFEGVPNYPTVSRFWEVIDKHKVNIFYTAPTAIRALMREGRSAGEEDEPRVAAAAWVPSASRSIRKPGSGITALSATAAARSSIRGGRRKPAAS